MLRFKQYLSEKVLSIGFNPDHDKFREQHRDQIHDIIQKSYSKVDGGYGGLGSGTKEESDAIHRDISNLNIKAVKRNNNITAVNMYKDQFGRKSVATGHDGSDQGKSDWKMVASEDIKQHSRNVWGEVSGGSEIAKKKLGAKEIPYDDIEKLTGKKTQRVGDTNRYVRDIGGSPHEKVGIGNPKV
jgi:hypothetical protein